MWFVVLWLGLSQHFILIVLGEPDCPVAATERGRRVPVCAEEYLTVADHDFTKFGMVPSCVLVIDLPEELSESWY